jgi:outer membrane protein, heavy metal efflux system
MPSNKIINASKSGRAGVYRLTAGLRHAVIGGLFSLIILLSGFSQLAAADLDLKLLINEAISNNPDLRAAGSRAKAAEFRVPQVQTLPDPIISFGYQNDGFSRYTYGQSSDSQWMFSASQTIPFPGKLALKGEAAQKESEGLADSYSNLKLKTAARVKEIYFDLLAAYKNLDLINERMGLFSAVEAAALARYSAGRASQLDALSAQTEKYLLLEKEVTLKQKIDSLEAALNTALARRVSEPLGRPVETSVTYIHYKLDQLVSIAVERSPEVRSKLNNIASAEARLSFARKDYLPDFTLTGGYYSRGGNYENMWSFTAGINIPLFFMRKQKNAENEADAALSEAKSLKEAAILSIAASLRENFAQMKTSEQLMSLYREGLIPKSRQDFELSLSGYRTGSGEAQTVISKLKSVIDYEIAYWGQFAEHEKAAARIEAVTGMALENK